MIHVINAGIMIHVIDAGIMIHIINICIMIRKLSMKVSVSKDFSSGTQKKNGETTLSKNMNSACWSLRIAS
jgi:hypothetical protein